MTVVNPKSISGINSITTGSGSDNLLTIHTSDASSTERVRINSSGDVIVGSGITVSPDGDIFATGVTTTGSLVSSGAISGTTGTFTSNVSIEGNTTLGNATSDTITFTGTVNSDLTPNGSTRDLGTSGSEWRNLYTANGVIASDDIAVHASDTNTKIRFPAADTITAETGGSERARIDSSGRLMLGTTSQNNNARLQVTTDQQVVATFEGTGSSDPQIYLGDDMSSPTDNCIILGYDKADNRGYLTVGGDADTVFQIKNGGDIEIGVGNLKFASGKGIDFSATTDASGNTSELFDDYEEGTWTPTLVAGNPVPSINTIASARYTKVGRLVTLQTYFSANNTSSNTDTLTIGNLPFTSANAQQYYYGSGRLGVQDRCVPQVNANSNQIVVYNNGGSTHNVNAIINTYILFSITYEAGS